MRNSSEGVRATDTEDVAIAGKVVAIISGTQEDDDARVDLRHVRQSLP